jgi:exodeoxyribonuclease VII large subunit
VSQPSFDLGFDDEIDGDGGLPTFTVGELAEAVNGALRRSFYDGIWVRGEIQGLNERGGHLYFSLTDDEEGVRATVAVSLFANVRFKLRPLLQRHRLRLADGMKVRLHGYLDFFAPSGRLSLKMSGIDPRYTLGELALQREELVRRLVAAGLYDAQARLPSPALPLTVGLVTSVGSAAWHDVTHELEASGFGFRIVACDARVQGEWAPEMVAAAIRTLGRRHVDVVLVVRGGGARSDLATFDTEVVARAIATCPRPVLTGLGHEVDRSVADEVAHLALKTPTACAGELIARVRQFQTELSRLWDAIADAAGGRLDAADRSLGATARQAARATRRSVDAQEAGLRRAGQALARRSRLAATTSHGLVNHNARRTAAASTRLLAHHSSVVKASGQRLARRAPAVTRQALRHLDAVEARVRALDPVRTLARGWTITRTVAGQAVASAGELAPGDVVVTTFVDGEVRSRVEEVDEP